MRRRWLLLVIGANLLALLALAIVYPQLMGSPGRLIRAHHELDDNCFACHAPWRGVDSQRCVRCHIVADIGLRTTKGIELPQRAVKTSFHQELTEQSCSACHSDHAALRLTDGSHKSFSHSLLRAPIRDQCQSCHHAPADRIHRTTSDEAASERACQAFATSKVDSRRLAMRSM